MVAQHSDKARPRKLVASQFYLCAGMRHGVQRAAAVDEAVSEAHSAEGRLDSDVHSRTFFGAGFVVALVSAAENRNKRDKSHISKFSQDHGINFITAANLKFGSVAVFLDPLCLSNSPLGSSKRQGPEEPTDVGLIDMACQRQLTSRSPAWLDYVACMK